MKKILFLHGFYASGQCVPAVALREAFEGEADVITPDLPMHPKEAVRFIRGLIESEKPDLLIGNSCGSFYAQMVAPVVGVPALLGNPHFQMTEFLKQRIGEHQYKSFHFPGGHTPTADEVRDWYVPLAEKLLRTNLESKIRYDKTDNIRL